VTVDGTDFRIYKKMPFWPGWKLFKFNGPGVQYKVGLCICTGEIVWIHGSFPCGQWPDIRVFCHALIHKLEEGEKVEADLGYRGEPSMSMKQTYFLPPKESNRNHWCGRGMRQSTKGSNNGAACIGISITMSQSMDLSSGL
jgi:hypothetical protein